MRSRFLVRIILRFVGRKIDKLGAGILQFLPSRLIFPQVHNRRLKSIPSNVLSGERGRLRTFSLMRLEHFSVSTSLIQMGPMPTSVEFKHRYHSVR